jgi:hypothetical protein
VQVGDGRCAAGWLRILVQIDAIERLSRDVGGNPELFFDDVWQRVDSRNPPDADVRALGLDEGQVPKRHRACRPEAGDEHRVHERGVVGGAA